ncbi:biotin--[acetyl-CoA-carboxylase] ligase [Mucilaginibacter sp. HMF5004]|uniref:biotin--[acetyl-CoA-carboxylase] ligase n=1 Tax=Mucilaginibacter rivuli TaxID=2857527 RepID=UPI001C5D313A|nr:biotin--[acetyl-CoA-carboxylase] ligase [Mucilaginibacter rivuli]MBW4890347.1 biotin--[acetyl-CoA-carboxylase] ligase [Mucilaginibacter rivuli]
MQNNTFSGLFVGQNLVTITELDSTNNFLKESLANSTPLPEGTVIMAEAQYAGRGQQNNKWNSEPGKNLTISILLKPSFIALSEQFNINVAISVGIIKCLQNVLGPSAKIKWPNDIYFGENKLGGVLIENMVQGERIKNAIIGIGLNVNQEVFPDWVPNPVSVKQILQRDYELKALLSDLCANIEAAYLMLRAGNFEQLKALYINQLYWYNEAHQFKDKDGVFEGTITGFEKNGQLIVSTATGIRLYNFKEIEFLNKHK